ncbi:DnaD domain protein [Candidatus Izemoplasma sp. B36]|uniref:DnaD domain protein n=1 Tax=Candidatus Izemoplasma sp. B36 TaxID=3242468 RepID=UPI003555EEC0
MESIRRSDSFIVSGEGICSSIDYQVLTLLYQPIIGDSAFNLYLTLMNLMDRQTLLSEEYLHADLESLLNRKLDLIEADRFKLEAIGLIVTFFAKDSFTYEIKLPLSARSFVNDGILGQYLISAITKTRFKKILKIFKINSSNKRQKYNISKAFNEVFPAIGNQDLLQENNLISGKKQKFVSLSKYNFNWRLFSDSVSEEIFNLNDLTEAIKLKIESLSYVYGLNELMMKDVMIKSLNDNNQVDIERLARNARYEYEKLNEVEPKKEAKEKSINRNTPTDPVEYFKSVSPIQLLNEIGDNMVSVADLRTVERLIDEVGLAPSVVNVLLAYIARTKEGLLPGFAYFQKVGQTWKRNQINTVEIAMDYVKHLESRKKSNFTGYNKNKPKDAEIDWLEDYISNME